MPEGKRVRQIDEEAVDRIVEGARKEKNLKEQLYDHIRIPIWLLDVIIALLVAALLYILIFKRGA